MIILLAGLDNMVVVVKVAVGTAMHVGKLTSFTVCVPDYIKNSKLSLSIKV